MVMFATLSARTTLKLWRSGAEDLGMKCPSCRTRELVVIELRVGGEPVTLRSCSHCDRRWWQNLDGSLSLTSVLDLVAQR
jgi:hypothetical protein